MKIYIADYSQLGRDVPDEMKVFATREEAERWIDEQNIDGDIGWYNVEESEIETNYELYNFKNFLERLGRVLAVLDREGRRHQTGDYRTELGSNIADPDYGRGLSGAAITIRELVGTHFPKEKAVTRVTRRGHLL